MRTLLIAVIVVASAGALSHSQPLLEVLVPSFDFGYTPQNATIVHYFWFKSAGTDTLVIDEIKTGCACAVMPLEENWIAPGDSMRVGIYWDISRYRGTIGRSPRVFTNAGRDPLRLHLGAVAVIFPDSVRPVTVKPYRFELAKSSRKVIDSLSFVLTNHSDRKLSVSLISSPLEECKLVLPDSIEALTSSTGYIMVKPEYADSEFETSITLLISGRDDNRVTIPIRRKFYGIKEN